MRLLLCKYKDQFLDKRYGLIRLPEAKALQLESKGVLTIVEMFKENAYARKAQSTTDTQSKFVKEKIGWVQDLSSKGGAEISNEYLIKIGASLGFCIKQITPQCFDYKFLLACNIIIINNFFEFTNEQQKQLLYLIYEKRIPYIKYEHDTRELSRLPFSRQLLELSRFNIFISPKHAELYKKYIKNNAVILPIAIDTSLFTNKNLNRESNSVLVPSLRKCYNNFKKYYKDNPNKTYKIILDGARQNTIDFVRKNEELISFVSYEQMPYLYNIFEEVFHCPDSFGAGERVYFEALLCGCTVLHNENVGHASWEFTKENLYTELSRAPFKFWKAVMDAI